MQVTLAKDNERDSYDTFDIVISDVPTEKAKKIQADVTALVFGLGETEQKASTDEKAKEIIINCFNRGQQPQYINAIRFYRCLTGANLVTAKHFVDGIRGVADAAYTE